METQKIAAKIAVQEKKNQVQDLHKYVVGFVGIFLLFIVTFPIAYLRVTMSEKYNGGAFNTLDWQDTQR